MRVRDSFICTGPQAKLKSYVCQTMPTAPNNLLGSRFLSFFFPIFKFSRLAKWPVKLNPMKIWTNEYIFYWTTRWTSKWNYFKIYSSYDLGREKKVNFLRRCWIVRKWMTIFDLVYVGNFALHWCCEFLRPHSAGMSTLNGIGSDILEFNFCFLTACAKHTQTHRIKSEPLDKGWSLPLIRRKKKKTLGINQFRALDIPDTYANERASIL